MNAMLRMDAVGRVGYGEKVIINMDHVVNIEEKIGVMDRRTCIINTIDGRAIEVNETLNDIWEFMNNLRKNSESDNLSDKPHCFDPDKRVEHVM